MILSVSALTLVMCVDPLPKETPRQVYGPWQFNKEKSYYYRKFEYKVSPNDKEYRHEYVIYFKEDGKKQVSSHWLYFFNPTTGKYWARYPTIHHPNYGIAAKVQAEVWSVLPMQHRHRDLGAIDPRHWPTPPVNFCPPLPSSTDGRNLDSPPADLP